MSDYLQQNKRFIPVGVVLVFVLVFSLIGLIGLRTPAYIVYIDDQEKLIVERPEEVDKVLEEIVSEKNKESTVKMELGNVIKYERVLVNKKSIVAMKDLPGELEKVLGFDCIAVCIEVDGKPVAYIESEDKASKLLEKLKTEYSQVDEGEELIEATFAEKVEIKKAKVSISSIMAEEKAYELIKTGTENPEKYTVKEGDSLWLIARRNNMYVDDISRANQLKTNKLSLGQELVLVKSKPYISVLAQVSGERNEEIPFETEVIVDKNSSSSIKIKQEGKNGKRHIQYLATICNGTVEKTEIKEETILEKAVNKVIIKGSGVTQVASRGGGGSGSLSWPVYGVITQYYKGSSHTGVDIASKRGTPMSAADGGYITFAGYQGSYGNLVTVDHCNGIVTRYAHCDSIKVSVGDEVSKGQTIATMGSTGRSTGPHLHFEVKVNGSFHNPLNYLR